MGRSRARAPFLIKVLISSQNSVFWSWKGRCLITSCFSEKLSKIGVVLLYKINSRTERTQRKGKREGEEHIRQPCVQKGQNGYFVSKKVVQFQNGKLSEKTSQGIGSIPEWK